MNTYAAVLIIQLLHNGQPIHHVQHITKHQHLNLQVCLDLRTKLRRIWSKKPDVEIIYIDCPAWWNEI